MAIILRIENLFYKGTVKTCQDDNGCRFVRIWGYLTALCLRSTNDRRQWKTHNQPYIRDRGYMRRFRIYIYKDLLLLRPLTFL